MRTELFDYDLPEELIATHPPSSRDGGRLLVLDRGAIAHRRILDFPELVPEGALLVVNDTRVRHARAFFSKKVSGGRVELLFLAPLPRDAADSRERWRALGRASRALRVGARLLAGALEAEIVAIGEGGVLELVFEQGANVEAWLLEHGRVPLPPYLRRSADSTDLERYQTVFAERVGSSAAPTAALHLSHELFERLRARGVERASLTLDIGIATFRPVEADDLDRHVMHAETFRVESALADSVAGARRRGAPVVAVGTTVVRALESAADPERPGHVLPRVGETRLLIQPGHAFRVVDALLTNFHQPKSTLLALVSAFAGREAVLSAYRAAVDSRYRFLSYGDAMWLPRSA